MRSHTLRQLRLWLDYLQEIWAVPDRRDYYLMQIAAEVRRGNVKKGRSVKIQDMELKFGGDGNKSKNKEQAAAIAKSRWLGLMTAPVKRVNIPPTS